MTRLLFAGLVFLGLAWTASPAPAFAQDSTSPSGGYDVEAFLRLTTFSDLALSPGGRTLAFVTSRDDFEEDETRTAVWMLELVGDSESPPRRLTWAEGSYGSLRWSPDGDRLAFVSTRGEGQSGQLFVVGREPGDPRPVTDEESLANGVRAFDWTAEGDGLVVATLASLPDSITEFYGDIRHYGGPAPGAEIHRFDIGNGDLAGTTSTQLAALDEVVDDLRVNPMDGRVLVMRGGPTVPEVHSGWITQNEVGILEPEGGETVRYITDNVAVEGAPRWSRDGSVIYFSSFFGHPDSTRLVISAGDVHTLDPLTGAMAVLAGSSGYEGTLQGFLELPDGDLVGLASRSTGTDVVRIDPAGGLEVASEFPDRVYGLTAGEGGVAFARSTATAFDEIWWSPDPGDPGAARPVTAFNSELSAGEPPVVEAFTWTNGDGQSIEGVLYWPAGAHRSAGLPLVVDIHGGPWSSRTAALAATGGGWAYYPALLASRGYLVLEPNYRGGTGRGIEFLRAIEGHSCSRPADDVLTGVDALVEAGWADPERMGVMGYSYGGLMTNCLIGRTNRFRVAASGAGLWNDASYFGSSDNFAQTDIRYDGLAPWEDPERFWAESPISRAGRIETPTLIVFGGADRRVPVEQGLELYRALEYQGVPAELLVFPGQGHGFTRPEYKLKKVQAELEWIDRYLKGTERRLVW